MAFRVGWVRFLHQGGVGYDWYVSAIFSGVMLSSVGTTSINVLMVYNLGPVYPTTKTRFSSRVYSVRIFFFINAGHSHYSSTIILTKVFNTTVLKRRQLFSFKFEFCRYLKYMVNFSWQVWKKKISG